LETAKVAPQTMAAERRSFTTAFHLLKIRI
jgi:hypothetical protein